MELLLICKYLWVKTFEIKLVKFHYLLKTIGALNEDIDWFDCHTHSRGHGGFPETTYTGLNIVSNFITIEIHFQTIPVCRTLIDMDDSDDDDGIIITYESNYLWIEGSVHVIQMLFICVILY